MFDALGYPTERRDIIRFVGIFFVVFPLAAMFNPPSRASILMLFRSGTADGVITHDADPSNHLYVSYQYTVNGKTYSGTGYGPNHADMKTGERTTVYYFPPTPSESVLVDAVEQRGYVRFGVVGGLLMGVFAGFGDYWNRQRHLREPPLQANR